MKVALLISGYLRSYENSLSYIKNEITNISNDVDVYLHITKNEKEEDRYLNLIDEDSDIKKIISELNPKSVLIERNDYHNRNKLYNNTFNQWSKLFKLNELKKINESIHGEKYDIVVRYRPDLSIKTKNLMSFKPKSNTVYVPYDSKIDKKKLKSPSDKYVCDAFAFGDSESMDKYFNIFTNIDDYISSYGAVSETILYNHLRKTNLKINKIDVDYSFILSKCNVFAICGDSGSGKSTLSKLLKNCFSDSFSLECDRYHKWERGDSNWTDVTHLDPKANYIEKMNEDVFNLKIGKEIFQVDYDHATGTFTEEQLINPSNNLIVCGLHTIYNKDSNSIYDIKIYMDPQEELKQKWKIKRDVIERGYTIEKVLESIKKRDKDFIEHILPQKDNADVIIRFFSRDNVDIYNLEHEDKLSLDIKISKSFIVDEIIKKLKYENITFTHISSEHYNQFIFDEYVKFSGDGVLSNTFYDYTLLFIFNLIFTN
jgi:uridine kinase